MTDDLAALREALAGANRIIAMIRAHLAQEHPDCAWEALGVMNDASRVALSRPAPAPEPPPSLDVERLARWAAYIVRAESPRDWACAECVPQSDMIVPGFRCVYHEAAEYARPSAEEPQPRAILAELDAS